MTTRDGDRDIFVLLMWAVCLMALVIWCLSMLPVVPAEFR